MKNDQRGFIFSLDATLAVLVIMMAMAGVARVGGPELVYGQHGYLRLERYAEDALGVMDQVGVLDSIIESIATDNDSAAMEMARDNLLAILPPEVQFKLVVGDETVYLDNVYPGTDNLEWSNLFESAEERAVASRVTTKRLAPLKVLVWVDTRLPSNQVQMIEDFIDAIDKPTWDVRRTSDEGEFRTYLLSGIGGWSPDAVFIPDSLDLQDATIDALIWNHNINHGGVVGGGGFLYNNQSYNFPFFGIWILPPIDAKYGYESMHIVDHTHPITATSPEYVDYAGDDYPVYEYLFLNPLTGEKATPLVDNLAYWPGTGGYWWWWFYIDQDWVALTARRSGIIAHGGIPENTYNRTVLFNAHMAQSAMDGVGTGEWITLAQRAIEWVSSANFEPIKLYVWRGGEAN